MKNTSILSLMMVTLLTTPLSSFAAQASQAVAVVAERVATHQVSQSLSLIGKLEAERAVEISSEVSGKSVILRLKPIKRSRKVSS